MIVYHGTTQHRARRISEEGFLPRKPSRRVWFAETRAYALGRAQTQARRAKDSAVVLTCDIDLAQMRKRLGAKDVLHRGGVIAIKAHVPVSVLRSHPGFPDQPSSPHDLAAWVNAILGLKPHKGVSRRDPGIDRLSRWVVNRMTSRPNSRIRSKELLGMARQWLPEFLDGVHIDPETLRVRRDAPTIEVEVELPAESLDPREDEALDCLVAETPRRRVRGLALLAELADPDLFDWCAMFLEDESAEVTVAALRTMLSCVDADLGLIAPFADSADKRVRAAATAAAAKHAGENAASWLERGLKDPEPCVRAETAALLSEIDPAKHKAIFHLALSDPNPMVAAQARRLVAGKGYPSDWRRYAPPD
jgi:hypothetical protein